MLFKFTFLVVVIIGCTITVLTKPTQDVSLSEYPSLEILNNGDRLSVHCYPFQFFETSGKLRKCTQSTFYHSKHDAVLKLKEHCVRVSFTEGSTATVSKGEVVDCPVPKTVNKPLIIAVTILIVGVIIAIIAGALYFRTPKEQPSIAVEYSAAAQSATSSV